MTKGLEYLTNEERLRARTVQTGKRRLRVILLITVYKYLVGGSKDDGGRLFSVVASDKAQGTVHELKYRKFRLIIKRHFLCVCACM